MSAQWDRPSNTAEWNAGIRDFHRECSGVVQMFLLDNRAVPEISAAVQAGNQFALKLMQVFASTAAEVVTAPEGDRVGCMCCSLPIRRLDGVVVSVVVASGASPKHGIGAAICHECAQGDDLWDRAESAVAINDERDPLRFLILRSTDVSGKRGAVS